LKANEEKCFGCEVCIPYCPVDCIELRESIISIDQEVCIDCELCVFICPIEVLSNAVKA